MNITKYSIKDRPGNLISDVQDSAENFCHRFSTIGQISGRSYSADICRIFADICKYTDICSGIGRSYSADTASNLNITKLGWYTSELNHHVYTTNS